MSGHLATMPEPERFRIITVGGRDYLAIHGPMPALMSFPSGGPVYIFDESGNLADWTSDAGDDDSYHRRWPGVYRGREVTREAAVKWPGRGR